MGQLTKVIIVLLIATSIIIGVYKAINFIIQKRLNAYIKQSVLADLRAIRSQMNPHFIFNSLNSINRYILKNETEKASDYLGRFAKLMRLVLDNSNHERIPLASELETMQLYVELEQLRFENSFSYELNVDDTINQNLVLVQPLIFQPCIENAIWHGLMHKKEGDKKLSFEITQNNGNLICEITDNGVGRHYKQTGEQLGRKKRKSYGINLVKDRLKLMDYNSELKFIDLVDNNEKPAGTKVIMIFKKIEDFKL
ncbi:MAG: sensor histidine kinase [Bacteroidia bacterium]